MEEKTVTEIVDLVRQLDDMVGEHGWDREEDIELVQVYGKYRARLIVTQSSEEDYD